MACKILGPQAGIKLESRALEAQSLNHWTARDVPLQHAEACLTSHAPSPHLSPRAARVVLGCVQGLNVCVMHLVVVLTQTPFLLPGFHATCPGLLVTQPCWEEKQAADRLRALQTSELSWINRPTAPKIGTPCLPHSVEMYRGHP